MSNMSNIFRNLPVDEEEYDHVKTTKKARKKIKAIDNLKKKGKLTDEEQNKVDSEDYWQHILNPFYENVDKKKENVEKCKENIEKKRKKREKKIRYQEMLNKKKEQRESEQRQRESEQRQKEFEQRQRQNEFEQEQRQRQRQNEFEQEQRQRQNEFEQEQIIKPKKTKNEKRIHIEFNLLISKGQSIRKAKHSLLRKYHPDKNKEKSANEMTQIINNMVLT
jgi:hypothetical protein